MRLAQLLDESGAIGLDGVEKLIATVRDALEAAEDKGVQALLPFATSAVREASNADDVLARVQAETGVELQVLTGAEEARLTFLAARRWFGWSAGKLLVLDIGGGSLEIAYGMDEEPDAAASLPLGAGRLTAGWLPTDPADPADIKALRRHVRPRSPVPSVNSAASAPPTTWSPPPRPSSSSPAWPAPPAPRTASTSSANSNAAPWRTGSPAWPP